MIRLSVLSLGLAISVSAFATDAPNHEAGGIDPQGTRYLQGTVDRVSDGDTIAIRVAGSSRPVKIRMVGEDTAELHLVVNGKSESQGWWAEAGFEHLKQQLAVGSRVRVQVYGEDTYGRTLGRVFDAKGNDVNLEMVRSGWGSFYVICAGASCNEQLMRDQAVEEFAEACEDAVRQEKGLFNARDPLREQPFEYRMRMQSRRPERHVGDMRTKQVYAPADYRRVPLCNRVFFGSEQEALSMGYRRAH